jgi:hypothetical protein
LNQSGGIDMKTGILLSAGVLALAVAGGATAATFGPATGDFAVLGSPTVTLMGSNSTESFSSPTTLFSQTGSLLACCGPGPDAGNISGTLDFSTTIGTTISQGIPTFLTFVGGFVFDVTSVTTLDFSQADGQTSIGLYVLGSASSPGLSAAPTSVTITSNETGGSAYSASGSISTPPSGIPEPASWTLMLVGCGALGAVLRSRRKAVLATA